MLDITYEIPYNEGCSVDKSIDAELTAVNRLLFQNSCLVSASAP
jgi:hypothetical protein